MGEKAKTELLGKFEAARVKLREQSNNAIEKDDAALVKAQQSLFDSLRKESMKADAEMWKVRNATAKAHYSYLSNLEKGKIDAFGNAVSRNGSTSGGFDLDIGKMFGAGSRNNFLNLIGKSIGGIVNLMQGLVTTSMTFVKNFQEGMAKAGDSASLFTKLGSGGSAAMAGLTKSGPGAVAALVIVTAAASILVSVLSALVGIVVALSATIVSALAGAAAVGAGALLAVVAAGGLLTAAFMSMTNAQKDMLSSAFQPLKAEMVGIGQIMLEQMVPAFDVWSRNLQGALVLLAPVAHVMGSAFAEAGSILTASFSGPGFQAMSVALGTFLPSIVRRLSSALGGFLNGTMGLFAAIMPMVNRFAGYLANVATRFSNWANSAKGQNAIVDFVGRAVTSLKSLWNFTREVFGFIGDLMFSREAQNAGNSMFDSMTRAFQDFRKAVARAIANGDLQKWFDRAIEFGSALWGVVKSLYKLFVTLESSGVLAAVAASMKAVAWSIEAVAFAASPLIKAIDWVGQAFDRNYESAAQFAAGLREVSNQALNTSDSLAYLLGTPLGMSIGQMQHQANNGPKMPSFDYQSLINSGNSALNQTYESSGGYKPDPKYHNPYTKWAQQFIDSGPSMAAQVRIAVREVNKQFRQALSDAAKATGADEARSIITASIESAISVTDAMVESARGAVSSAAQTLASASSRGDASRALKRLRKMQEGLRNAVKAQTRIEHAITRVGKQRNLNWFYVDRLLKGEKVNRATLADYAAARERLAGWIEKANQRLADAISMRNDYKAAVVDAVKSFGSILSAQASTVDGIEQALTAADITGNLQTRLDKIREFQDNLRKLLALGLNDDAYKQLVDGGVEAGGEFAAALVAGGSGAVAQTNSLTDQIASVAESLGLEASNRLYQAGVDAAQGLVDGLTSLSAQLDAAATRLGNSIAAAVKKALGIKSPSTVMIAAMGNVGDGLAKGLDQQHVKVGSAAARLSSQVAVSPEVAAYAARQGAAATVSGNGAGRGFRDLIVHTPTENPAAVAQEVLNEVTGRL